MAEDATLRILLVNTGENILLLVGTGPAAYSIELTDAELEKLGNGCHEMVARRRKNANDTYTEELS